MANATAQKVFYSRHSYGEVVGRDRGMVTVRNEHGKEWSVSQEIFDAEFRTTAEHTGGGELTRDDLLKVLYENQREIMVVTFRKKVKPVELRRVVSDLITEGLKTNQREFKRRFDDALAGETRVMVGRHEGSFDERGRLRFVDMESKGLRLIDPRTAEHITVRGKSYYLKD
jgi:hypothetical protein